MRHLVVVASLLLVPGATLVPGAAVAQTAAPTTVAQEGAGLEGHRMLAIAVGAVVGVIVANGLTGGMITPVLLAGTGGGTPVLAAAAAEPAVAAVQAGIIIVGGMVGGYLGDWVYGN
jgi:hypothetical protein